jgi:twitching motility protein PilT
MMQTGRASGMATLNDALFDLVKKKVVEPKEAWMKSIAKSDFKALLERANIRVDLEA